MTIYDDRECFYQWDVDQKITSDTFKVGDTIHFANKDQIEALPVKAYMLDGQVVADVPNILLEASLPLKVWKYEYSEHSAQTTEEHVFDVKKRAKPSDHVYTETELYELRRTAEEATAKAIRTEAEVASAENERQIDELDREFNETERITAEVARVTAENERLTAETTRLSAEQARVSAESARIVAEQQRQSAETVRQTAFEQSYNNVANTLKGTVSGEVIRVDDVSPIDHIVKVKATADYEPSTIKVTRCGKNLITNLGKRIEGNGITWTLNEDGTVTANGTAETLCVYNFEVVGATSSLIGKTVTIGGCPPGGAMDKYAVYQRNYGQFDVGSGKTFKIYNNNHNAWGIVIAKGVTVTNLVFKPQVEFGDTKTEFETPTVKTYTTSTDGMVNDINSVSPTMTLLTDTEGVTIEAEYNRDINIVINDILKTIKEMTC